MYRNDRRIFDRFAADFTAELKYPQAEEAIFAQCADVSASGVGIYTEDRLIPNTNPELWLSIPDGHPPFRGLARVIWTKQVQENKWRSGLEFRAVDFMGVRRIFDAVGKKTR